MKKVTGVIRKIYISKNKMPSLKIEDEDQHYQVYTLRYQPRKLENFEVGDTVEIEYKPEVVEITRKNVERAFNNLIIIKIEKV